MASHVPEIDALGLQRWYKDGELHRDDGPALLHVCGDQEWFQNGKWHRDGNLPAIVYTDGEEEWFKAWYKYGKQHREDGPAILNANGLQAWYKNDKLHRDCDLPAIVHLNGYQAWYKDGKRHRDIGPARLDPPKFYEHDIERGLSSIKGETLVAVSPASWSPVLCFL